MFAVAFHASLSLKWDDDYLHILFTLEKYGINIEPCRSTHTFTGSKHISMGFVLKTFKTCRIKKKQHALLSTAVAKLSLLQCI